MSRIVLAFAALALSLSACSSKTKEEAAAPAPAIAVDVVIEDHGLSGNLFAFSLDKTRPLVLSEEQAMIDFTNKAMTTKMQAAGFKIINSFRKSHVSGHVAAVKATGYEKSSAQFKNPTTGQLPEDLYTVYFNIAAKSYGKRPQNVFMMTVTGPQKSLTAAAIEPILTAELAKLTLTPPAKNQKAKGDPGCMPRLGYDMDNTQPGKTDGWYITKVIPKSAAEKAGIKVGDKFIEINGTPAGAWLNPHDKEKLKQAEELYESGKMFSVKVAREGKEKSLKVKPKIECSEL